ncbi:hypothetical protein TNCV_4719971 [Trichonephila clavipes]|uniref:Uncharacterized protein n=1 Tax=Trichonephila clavipes TaxID=2585209 RepID=A0A8X6W5X0_TRICX|nr:hypothetical protein TNCV_4719971 [Trichonephila clavipes]
MLRRLRLVFPASIVSEDDVVPMAEQIEHYHEPARMIVLAICINIIPIEVCSGREQGQEKKSFFICPCSSLAFPGDSCLDIKIWFVIFLCGKVKGCWLFCSKGI